MALYDKSMNDGETGGNALTKVEEKQNESFDMTLLDPCCCCVTPAWPVLQ